MICIFPLENTIYILPIRPKKYRFFLHFHISLWRFSLIICQVKSIINELFQTQTHCKSMHVLTYTYIYIFAHTHTHIAPFGLWCFVFMMSTEFSSDLRKSKNPFKIPKPQQLNYIATVQIPHICMYTHCFMGVEISHIIRKEYNDVECKIMS